jgi:hypothetical protein
MIDSDDDEKESLQDQKESLVTTTPNENEKQAGMEPRKITDLFCLIVFFAFCGGLIWIGMYAFENGDIRRLSHGFNYKGRLCGEEVVC